jgi:hypothetical protein
VYYLIETIKAPGPAGFDEAEQTARCAVEIYGDLGFREDVDGLAISLNELASILVANARLDDATKNWDPSQLDRVRLNQNRIFTHYYAGKLQDGIALAQSSNKEKAVGDKHVDFAMAQTTLGGASFTRIAMPRPYSIIGDGG